MKAWIERLALAETPRIRMLDAAARCVMALGYAPADCLIEQMRPTWSLDIETVEVDRLSVLGEPCFEVTTRRSPMVDFTFTVTTTPRLIAWPPNRTSPAHQHPRTTDAP